MQAIDKGGRQLNMKQRLQDKLTLLTTNRNSDILLMHTVISKSSNHFILCFCC